MAAASVGSGEQKTDSRLGEAVLAVASSSRPRRARWELIPLYVHYVDDHIERLHAVNHHRLADSFQQ